jgi:hypothetical protein
VVEEQVTGFYGARRSITTATSTSSATDSAITP